MSIQEVKKKLHHYCAYQERCHQEVNEKLHELGVDADTAEEVVHHLITEGFLNEERFARLFASGKFRQKKWGRLKIIRELEQRNLSFACIKAGLAEIDPIEYQETLGVLLSRKVAVVDAPNVFTLRDRVSRYAILKGFEPELVWRELKALVPDRS
jgi:regulatory protein